MYGTVAKMRAKPGAEAKLIEMSRSEDMMSIPGLVSTLIYRMDNDPNEYYLVVAFESKESYVKNAESPEQDARYRQFLEYLEGEPEWHDGEVVYSTEK